MGFEFRYDKERMWIPSGDYSTMAHRIERQICEEFVVGEAIPENTIKLLSKEYKGLSLPNPAETAKEFVKYAEKVVFALHGADLLAEPKGTDALNTQTPSNALDVSRGFHEEGMKKVLEGNYFDRAHRDNRNTLLEEVKKAELSYVVARLSQSDVQGAKDKLTAACQTCIDAHVLNQVNGGKLYNGTEATGEAMATAFATQLETKIAKELDVMQQVKMEGFKLQAAGAGKGKSVTGHSGRETGGTGKSGKSDLPEH